MADLKITELDAGTVKDTDLHVAVDTTDTTMAASGTDKNYLWSDLKDNVIDAAFTVTSGQLLIAAGAGVVPTGDADLTFSGGDTLNVPIVNADVSVVLNGATSGATTLIAAGTTTPYTITLPNAAPAGNGYFMSFATTGVATFVAASTVGDVTGPASATDEAFARFNLTTGKLIQNSVVLCTDAGVVTGATQLNVDNLRLDGNTLSTTNTDGALILSPNGTGNISCLGPVWTDEAFVLTATSGPANTISRTTTTVTSSYTLVESPSIPTTGQSPYVVGVVGSVATLGWQSGSVPVNSTVTTNWSGPWAAPQAGNIRATTDGNTVTLLIPLIQTVASIGGTDIRNTGFFLPAGLRPAMSQNIALSCLSDNTNAALLGNAAILTTGEIIISLAQAGINHVQCNGAFTGSGATGWVAFPLCYSLAA